MFCRDMRFQKSSKNCRTRRGVERNSTELMWSTKHQMCDERISFSKRDELATFGDAICGKLLNYYTKYNITGPCVKKGQAKLF